MTLVIYNRAVGRSENRGYQYYLVGTIFPPMVEIRITDLPKYGGFHGTLCIPRDNMPALS